MIEEKTKEVPLKILNPYRAVSVVFGVLSILAISAFFWFGIHYRAYLLVAPFVGHAFICGALAYGFWSLKKWLSSMMGFLVLISLIFSVVDIFYPQQSVSNMEGILVLTAILFLPVLFSRNFLKGKYAFITTSLFVVILMSLMQISTYFIK